LLDNGPVLVPILAVGGGVDVALDIVFYVALFISGAVVLGCVAVLVAIVAEPKMRRRRLMREAAAMERRVGRTIGRWTNAPGTRRMVDPADRLPPRSASRRPLMLRRRR
jgi:hypothetical protein